MCELQSFIFICAYEGGIFSCYSDIWHGCNVSVTIVGNNVIFNNGKKSTNSIVCTHVCAIVGKIKQMLMYSTNLSYRVDMHNLIHQ